MKVFVSYPFTGEDEMVLTKRLQNIKDLFGQLKIDHYINIYDPGYETLVSSGATGGDYLRVAFKHLADCNTVLVIMTSPRRSEGMLMEVGASVWLNKNIILAQHQSAVGQTYLPTVANKTVVWSSEDELLVKIKQLFSAL